MRGTAIQIIQQAAAELGLPVPQLSTSSQEQTSIQMFALLNALGNNLQSSNDWEFLRKTDIVTTVAGQTKYTRPADFDRQINQTIWDRGMRRPVIGPLTPQNWAWVKNRSISVGPFLMYRITDNYLEFNPDPGNDSINYEYVSSGWVQSYLDPAAFTPTIQNVHDTPLFDMWLLVKGLKLRLWQAKGLDTTALEKEYQLLYDSQTSQDEGAPMLNLAPRAIGPYITVQNVPDGNWNTFTGGTTP